MDAALATPKPSNISFAQAATVGVGFYTACLGVLGGLNIPIPEDPKNLPAPTGEYVLVLGGSSSVGKFAIQLLKALGYKVLTTASPKSSSMLKSLGATEVIDYKLPQEEQISIITDMTSGKLHRIFDAVASNHEFAATLYKSLPSSSEEKYFSTTNDWTPLSSADFNGAHIEPVKLGPIGQPDAKELNATITKLLPLMYYLIESGAAKPAEYEIIGEGGFEGVAEAWAYQQTGKAGAKKVVVKLQDA
jgi:NADPH:quinone reductase-like Zn-dependent oxidoreductase